MNKIEINEFDIFLAELHMSPSQKQKCLTFSLILMSLHPLAVLMPMAFAFINSSDVKHRLLAGVSRKKNSKSCNLKLIIYEKKEAQTDS